jgi:hypothetical protein
MYRFKHHAQRRGLLFIGSTSREVYTAVIVIKRYKNIELFLLVVVPSYIDRLPPGKFAKFATYRIIAAIFSIYLI